MAQPMNIASNAPATKATKILNVSEEQQVQIFAKQMLAKRLFLGHYQERRYVDILNSYRDIVCVSETEDDLPHDLNIVKKRVQQIYPCPPVWTGITGPESSGAPAGCCLWVKLSNLPFGLYWFQIREVKFLENSEICVRLKCLRSVSGFPDSGLGSSASADLNKQGEVSSTTRSNNETPKVQDTEDIIPSIDIQEMLSSIKNIRYDKLVRGWLSVLSEVLTPHNLGKAASFLVALLITVATGLVKFVLHLGDFSLKAMREISLFVQVCTPVMLGIIDFFSKCFGGILILITVLWRGGTSNHGFSQNFMAQRALPPPLRNNRRQSPPSFTYPQNRKYSPPS